MSLSQDDHTTNIMASSVMSLCLCRYVASVKQGFTLLNALFRRNIERAERTLCLYRSTTKVSAKKSTKSKQICDLHGKYHSVTHLFLQKLVSNHSINVNESRHFPGFLNLIFSFLSQDNEGDIEEDHEEVWNESNCQWCTQGKRFLATSTITTTCYVIQ